MPSSHTALVVGLTTAIGLKDALDSSIFALCLVFSLVVRARVCFLFFGPPGSFGSLFLFCFDHKTLLRVLNAKGFSRERERGFLKPSSPSLSDSLSLLVL